MFSQRGKKNAGREISDISEPMKRFIRRCSYIIPMEENSPVGKSKRTPDLSVVAVSVLGVVLAIVIAFALISIDFFPSGDETGRGVYQWAAHLEYSQEVNISQVSAELDEQGIHDYSITFDEETWTSDRLFGDSIPGESRIWNIHFNYNLTVDVGTYGISNETLQQLGLIHDDENGTLDLPIHAEIYNNHYDDGFGSQLDMYDAHISGPWSDYGIIFDGIPWEDIIEDEMPNFIQMIHDATGLNPKSSEVVKQYS